MAISPTSYATAAEYRAAMLGVDISQDTDIDLDIAAVSRHVDNVCERFFGKDSAAVARTFRPDTSTDTLFVGDMSAAPTSVKIDTDDDGSFSDETALATVEVLPRNAALNAEARPYHSIHLPTYAATTVFTGGLRVEVTAVWGWAAVPSGIKRATIQLAAILRMQSPRATSRYDDSLGQVFGASREARTIIREMIELYGLKEGI